MVNEWVLDERGLAHAVRESAGPHHSCKCGKYCRADRVAVLGELVMDGNVCDKCLGIVQRRKYSTIAHPQRDDPREPAAVSRGRGIGT